ncbi:MAG: SDR family oxidoreductase [Alphaproteobacteria bacterium]|nr:SDR family oxidoreductase [Alphaproteobacteria bacterium]
MNQRAVLITGAAQRVGAAMALHFAQNGYDIALHYNLSQSAAGRIKKDIEQLGARCVLLRHDMQDIAGIANFMREVRAQMPYCTALVNNASVFDRASFQETDEAFLDRQFTVNFKAPFFLTQAFSREFTEGCVINMLDSEISGTQGSHFAYLLSKKALADFTAMAARQLGPYMRVNAICPGILLPSNELDAAYIDRLSGDLPQRRVGTLEEVVSAALWLAQSPVTGQFIYIDGGQQLL